MVGVYSENTLIEQPAIQLFRELGWETADCMHEMPAPSGSWLGRESKDEVVLVSRLRPALERLNPDLAPEAIKEARDEIIRDRSLMTPANANRDVYKLLKDGVPVSLKSEQDSEYGDDVRRARVIDWERPENNDFLLASQFSIAGDLYTRRPDLIGFVNGIPLVFVELKASQVPVKRAFDDNLTDYKSTIPQLFWYTGFLILSNGSESRLGTLTASWEHFTDWKKINSEGEQGVVALETMIRGTCEPTKLLDIVENFTVFMETKGGTQKIVARNHQYLGVNNAIDALQGIEGRQGKLGVFWHTQGSGKSISMIFFAQKVLRKVPGNWTFLIVTDRLELDDQIYKNFAGAGAITSKQARAESGEDLKKLLRENHRYVFTLIQKFHTERGQRYPTLSERDDIIVITDEAHRSQYDVFAMNMRAALPDAKFIGFTGTPLMVGEERTRQEFGDYVSIYNFKQSIDDGATVPLYYENRIPELQLTNEQLNDDMERLLEEAELDEDQERKLEREFARQYHLITRDDRLEAIARDLVEHFMGRGHLGKAMVVSIDKATAVRMYDKVQNHWQRHLAGLRARLAMTNDLEERDRLEAEIRYMDETDMTVVVSQSQNEIADMRAKGLDIEPHRRRMVTEDLDSRFKDENDPFRIVFVCAMWMTGFDVPSCSTIYLDKPMRNHTLMQTIARANRVAPGKVNGLIVDYVGVFRDLQKALAIYGTDPSGGAGSGEMPVKDKSELVEQLKIASAEARGFLDARGVDVGALLLARGLDVVGLKDQAMDRLLETDDIRKQFLAHATNVDRIYKAVLPDQVASEYAPFAHLMRYLSASIKAELPDPDITEVMESVEELLDRSVATEAYVIREDDAEYEEHRLVDLSQIDFEALQRRFVEGRKNIEANRLRGQINSKLRQMVRLNQTRMDYMDRFQQLIDEYNAGSMNVEEFFEQLKRFTRELTEEGQRHIAEQISEEELALFDLLTKPDIELTESERRQVKKVARDLLNTLKAEKLVLDWRKRQQSRAAVRICIEEFLDRLPEAYCQPLFDEKVELTYQHIYDAYADPANTRYAHTAA